MRSKPGRAALAAILLAGGSACGGSDEAAQTAAPAVPTEASMLAASCGGCHTPDGSAIVSVEGHSTDELETLLLGYKQDDGSTVMHRLARGYSEDQIRQIALYLSAEDGQ